MHHEGDAPLVASAEGVGLGVQGYLCWSVSYQGHVCQCRQPEQPSTAVQQPTEQVQPAEKAQAEDKLGLDDLD